MSAENSNHETPERVIQHLFSDFEEDEDTKLSSDTYTAKASGQDWEQFQQVEFSNVATGEEIRKLIEKNGGNNGVHPSQSETDRFAWIKKNPEYKKICGLDDSW